ncbi:ankyrin [Colletotrichum eremochloae]|nr:ankyrin [Colletotrichum eremochloae]
MWFIDSRTLELVEVQGDPRHSYAILSHTWGSDEVTFQSFKAMSKASNETKRPGEEDGCENMRAKSGFQKIRDTAVLAKSHGYDYLWVDTCCIDKTSSAELSESINSMYRWYEKAGVCYAYLSDVEPVDKEDPFSETSSFRRSRWFTRGWTLQELIAPNTVEFYAHNWSFIDRISSESNFCQLVAEITGIHPQVLAGTTSLVDVSIANKMRWAALRQTTRPEDIAYCMMGLFNVNMPLLYGEGERSFLRLQEEILKETDDQSLFLWGLSSGGSPNSDDLFGLLAKSPKAFSQVAVGHVRPLPPPESYESSPASVTNQGLRTTMLLIPVRPDTDEYYAVLDCLVSDSTSSSMYLSPRIILRRLWSDQFARVNSKEGSVILLPQEQSDEAGGSYESIYVRQNPFYALPELRVRSKYPKTAGTKNDGRVPFSINGVHPPERWDAALSVIRTKEPQSDRTIAVLRFDSNEPGHASVCNVAIGLRRISGRWEVCHEKYPDSGDSLESVYLRTPNISAGSQAASYQASNELGYITIDTTEYQRRGRRIILLEVFSRSELNVDHNQGPLVQMKLLQLSRNPVPPFDEITAATQLCCYEETFSDIVSPIRETRDGVRIRFSGNIATRFGSEVHAARIGRNSPYVALLNAIRARDDRTVQKLAKKNNGILEMETDDFDKFRAIHWAAALGSQPIVKTLMRLGVDTTSRSASGFMAVHIALLNGHLNLAAYMLEEERELVGWLWESESVWSEPSQSPDIFHKFTTGRLDTILHLLSAYRLIEHIKGDLLGSQSFPHINCLGSLQALEALVDLTDTTSQINARDDAGRSVLFHAACVSLGAMLDVGDDYGRSPLHAAVMAGKTHAVEALLALGAAADNVTHALGLTPLHFACLYGRDSGSADVNRWSTGDGAFFQPLHLAVANGYLEAVSRLCEAGCETEHRSGKECIGRLHKLEDPKNPMELAFSLNHPEIGAELRRFQKGGR